VKKNNSVYIPKYFKKIDDGSGPRWEYSGNYWEERAERIANVDKAGTSTATVTSSTVPISTSDSADDLVAINDNDNDSDS